MTFDQWWATLSHKEQLALGLNNAKFVWKSALSQCEKLCRKEAERALLNLQRDISENQSFWTGAEQMAANLANDIQSRVNL